MTDFIEKTKQALSSISENVNELLLSEKTETAQLFKDSTSEKINSMLEEITQLNNTISKAGFELSEINISIGLPPTFAMNYKFISDISETEEEVLLEDFKDKKISTIILKTLFKSTLYAQKLKMGEYKLGEVDIVLGIIPEVTLKFIK